MDLLSYFKVFLGFILNHAQDKVFDGDLIRVLILVSQEDDEIYKLTSAQSRLSFFIVE